MTEISRRALMTGAVLGGAALTGVGTPAVAHAARPDTGTGKQPGPGPVTIAPDDARYPSLNSIDNLRFVGDPEQIVVVRSTAQVVAALQDAVAAGKRIAARSGGHSFEGFTSAPDIEILLDLSELSEIEYDETRGAFLIGPGATLGDVYETLFKNWGVTIPAGSCFSVAAGGHFAGGGYGHLSRRYGLVADHVLAVEVVVVDKSGKARVVTATRDPADPNHDLWWACSGGGGGNFGIVTRYWLRSRTATSHRATAALPKAPGTMRRRTVVWAWDGMDETNFVTILRNFCVWYENNSAPDSPNAPIWSILSATHRSAGSMALIAVVDEAVPNGSALLEAHVDAVLAGTTIPPMSDERLVLPWMTPQNWPAEPGGRYKHKSADLRGCYTPAQMSTIYRYLSSTSYDNPAANLGINGYGGQVNALDPTATATATRDAILKAVYSTGVWDSPDDDARNLAWVRAFYRDVYADTGGVPVPDAVSAGTYINYVDADLADPAWNTSGVPWQYLYYRDNYPRLQQVKARYDPLNVFRSPLSVELPS